MPSKDVLFADPLVRQEAIGRLRRSPVLTGKGMLPPTCSESWPSKLRNRLPWRTSPTCNPPPRPPANFRSLLRPAHPNSSTEIEASSVPPRRWNLPWFSSPRLVDNRKQDHTLTLFLRSSHPNSSTETTLPPCHSCFLQRADRKQLHRLFGCGTSCRHDVNGLLETPGRVLAYFKATRAIGAASRPDLVPLPPTQITGAKALSITCPTTTVGQEIAEKLYA